MEDKIEEYLNETIYDCFCEIEDNYDSTELESWDKKTCLEHIIEFCALEMQLLSENKQSKSKL